MALPLLTSIARNIAKNAGKSLLRGSASDRLRNPLLSMQVGFTLEGSKGMIAGLRTAPDVVQKRVITRAIKKGGSVVQKRMKSNARRYKDTGALSLSISTRVKSYKRDGVVAASIGPRVGWSKGGRVPSKYDHLVEEKVNPHIIRPRNARALSSQTTGGEDALAHPLVVEVGHPGRAATPFIRPSVEGASRVLIDRLIADEVRTRLPKELAKHMQKKAIGKGKGRIRRGGRAGVIV